MMKFVNGNGAVPVKDWRDYPDGREKYQLYLAGREWAVLREAVRERSGGTCERCKAAPGENVHHQTYERIYRERLEDLVHLCIPCHEFVSGKRSDDPASRPQVGHKELSGSIRWYSPKSSGQQMAIGLLAEAQKFGNTVSYVDVADTLDIELCNRLGIDLDRLLISKPENAEEAIEIVEMLLRSNAVDWIVVSGTVVIPSRFIELCEISLCELVVIDSQEANSLVVFDGHSDPGAPA